MDEQNKRLAEIRKRCTKSCKVLKVFQIMIVVAAALTLFAGIFMLSNSERLNPMLEREYAAGNLKIDEELRSGGLMSLGFDFDNYYSEGNFTFPLFILSMAAFVAEVLTLAVVIIIKNILGALIDEESPFSETIFKKLKIGFIMITASLLLTVGLGTALIVGLVLWCVYAILEYGAALQAEVDGTL